MSEMMRRGELRGDEKKRRMKEMERGGNGKGSTKEREEEGKTR